MDGLSGRFELVVSPTLLGELDRVLLREKFRRYLSEPEVHQLIAHIRYFTKFKTIRRR